MQDDYSTEQAPAKINLDLLVTGQRLDGYHELDSLVVFTAYGDRLLYKPADRFELTIVGPFAHETPVQDNIILKAARVLQRQYAHVQPLAFRLEKNLPVSSGIGGGSSDAAAAMRAIVKSSNLPINAENLRDIGGTLGADIPVCLYAHAARMRGTGDRLDPVRGLPAMSLVLVNPGVAIRTMDIFRSRSGPFSLAKRGQLAAHSSATGISVWLKESHNDLEPAAKTLAPVINDVIKSIERQDGNLYTRMSGSGATCFGIFSDSQRADRAANIIASENPDWWVVATQTID